MREPINDLFVALEATEVLPQNFATNDNNLTLYFPNCLAASIFMNSLAQKNMEIPTLKGNKSLMGQFKCIIPKDMLDGYFSTLNLQHTFDSIIER
jgi:hypothetical protein